MPEKFDFHVVVVVVVVVDFLCFCSCAFFETNMRMVDEHGWMSDFYVFFVLFVYQKNENG